MALLDSIFSGETSVTALLANMLAGNAMIICPGKQQGLRINFRHLRFVR